MLRPMAVFRWATWIWLAAVLLDHRGELAHPVFAWAIVGAALAWTISATVLVERDADALQRRPAILCELAIGAALGIAGGIAYAQTHNPNVAFASVRTLGFAWPLAGIITAGIVFGPLAGAIAGVVVAIPRIFSPVVNGLTFAQYKGGSWISIGSTIVLYALAGAVAGYMARLLKRAENEVAAARAREQVARTLHDGVLQTLAAIERRSTDPQLARLALEQDRELREFLFNGDGKAPAELVCDLNMPNGGGLKVAKECGEITCIVMLTVSEQERDLLDAVAAGAQGYLVKSTPGPELRAALLRAAKGEPVFSSHLASLVFGEFRRMAKNATGSNPLSDREREVLQYVARGYSYKDIGERLFISPKTVENHVRNILSKLHLNRKQELIRYAVEHGIE
jgi:DNA-binding NarL/FixJ family response regulator